MSFNLPVEKHHHFQKHHDRKVNLRLISVSTMMLADQFRERLCVNCVFRSSKEKDPIWLCDNMIKEFSKRWVTQEMDIIKFRWRTSMSSQWRRGVIASQSPHPTLLSTFHCCGESSIYVQCRLKSQSCSKKGIMRQGGSRCLGSGLWRQHLIRTESYYYEKQFSLGGAAPGLQVFNLWEEACDPCWVNTGYGPEKDDCGGPYF